MLARRSKSVHDDPGRPGREGTKICLILREHDATWLGKSNNDRVDRGLSPGPRPQQRSPPSQTFGNSFGDEARLEEPVDVRVAPGMTLERFDQDDGGNNRRPQIGTAESFDERHCRPRPLRESRNRSRIKNQRGH